MIFNIRTLWRDIREVFRWERLPKDPLLEEHEMAPRVSLFRMILEPEPLPEDPPLEKGIHKGIINTIFGLDALPQDPPMESRRDKKGLLSLILEIDPLPKDTEPP